METPSLFELQIDGESSGFLHETSRWAKFLSILGFIGCGFMVLISLTIMVAGSSNPLLAAAGYNMTAVGILYLVMAVISIFPYLYLYQFSVQMQEAIRSSDQEQLNSSFSKLKSCFKFVGILSIIMLGFVVLAFIGGIIGGLMMTR